MRDASARPAPGPAVPPPGPVTDTTMRDASSRPPRQVFHCAACGREVLIWVEGIYARATVGSAHRFCDPACRQRAYRRRKAGVAEDSAAQLAGGRRRSLTKPGPAQDHRGGGDADA